jgi:hypothetical protein
MGRDDCCSVLSSSEWKVYLQLILLEWKAARPIKERAAGSVFVPH